MSKAMSLKAKIRNIAKQKDVPAQVILQNYMFERLLVRLSMSEFKEKFVLKGRMLVAAIVGLDNRATMDMDTTLKNLPLTPEAIRTALEDICNISCEDDVSFDVGKIAPIREDDLYGGYRVMLNAKFETLITPLSIDVSTDDVITPNAMHFSACRLCKAQSLAASFAPKSAQNFIRFRSLNFSSADFWLRKAKTQGILCVFPSILTQRKRKSTSKNRVRIISFRLKEAGEESSCFFHFYNVPLNLFATL